MSENTSPSGHRRDVLSALRRMKGSATAGDVVAATGLAVEEARTELKALLEDRRGHLAVTDSGEILYTFDPRLIRRDAEPVLERVKRATWKLFRGAFKAWIVAMLVVYLVVFVVLVLAAIFAGQRGGSDRGGGWGGRGGGHRGGGWGGHRGGVFPIPNFWLWYWIWGPRWRLGRPYYGHRWEGTLDREDRIPFYKKVFAFVFGPDRPESTPRQRDRSVLRLVRARRGVLTTAELVEHTGLPLAEAESEMGRLVGAYDGEPIVSGEGEVAYAFPGLMTSAHGPVAARDPDPAWLRLEYPLDLTGNTAGANAAVAGINGFNLLAAASAPSYIFPRLGIGGTEAWVALVWIPLAFSALFFALPGLRMLGVKRENRRRHRRNVRRVLLGLVYRRALEGGSVDLDEAAAHVARRLEGGPARRDEVEVELHRIAAEFDADVEPDEAGEPRFRFRSVKRAFVASETLRRSLALEDRTPGEIVYSTADTAAETSERDRAAFDRELLGYVPATERVGYEADWEVVAFEEELAGRGIGRA